MKKMLKFSVFTAVGRQCSSCNCLNSGQFLRKFSSNSNRRLCNNSRISLRSNNGSVKTDPTGPRSMGYVKPVVFGTAFGLVSYASCAIWEYESHRWSKDRSRFRSIFLDDDSEEYGSSIDGPWFYNSTGRSPLPPKRGEFRRKANSWWNSLNQGQKTVVGVLAANTAVLLFMRVAVKNASLGLIGSHYFLLSPTSSMASLVLSTFTHYSFVHFGMNMYVLWSLAPFAHVMGQQQFTAFYLTSGVFANVASIIYRQSPFCKLAVASLGASGCLYALIGSLCVRFPHVEFGVPVLSDLIPTLHFKAENLWPGLLAFDLIGLIGGFRIFDHVAHMAGLLFGVGYSKEGDKWLWSKSFRQAVVSAYLRIRNRNSD